MLADEGYVAEPSPLLIKKLGRRVRHCAAYHEIAGKLFDHMNTEQGSRVDEVMKSVELWQNFNDFLDI